MSRVCAPLLAFACLAGSLIASPPVAAANNSATLSEPSPDCVRYIVSDEGGLYTSVNIINDCLVPYTLRLDTRLASDSDCVYVPPKERRNVTIYTPAGPLGEIRGVVIC